MLLLLASFFAQAGKVNGLVLDEKGNPLPFVTISIRKKGIDLISNEKGEFSINLEQGRYQLTCLHVGYKSKDVFIQVLEDELPIRIMMEPNTLLLDEIRIKPGKEDPAYEIIRNAIGKRKENLNAVNTFSCKTYLKGMVRTTQFPSTFMGQKIDFEDGDSSKNKIIFLSETIAKIHFRKPDETRVDVISTKVSGQSNGFGLATPFLISFYENNIQLPRAFNPRGFISPIADGALSFYDYRYLGAFSENGRLVNRIQVLPKRKYEPLFSGYIQIIEDTWNIHAVDLTLNKTSQLELVNKLNIRQQMDQQGNGIWMLKNQAISLEVNILGFAANGNFTTLYSDYQLNIKHEKGTFDDTIIKYDSASNKRDETYWQLNRPLPLLKEEIDDYRKKDSLEKKRNDPAYLDSLDRIQNKLTFSGILLNGQTLIRRSKNMSFEYDPLLKVISYNTVEGWTLQFSGTYEKRFEGRNALSLTPVIRYGTSNGHFNAFLNSSYQFGKKYVNSIGFSAGKKVFQFNNSNPVPQIMNTFSTLLNGQNHLKIYEATFFQVNFAKGLGKGLETDINFSFQDRNPLKNLDKISLWSGNERLSSITPNQPFPPTYDVMSPHAASILSFRLRYRPGTKYVQLPDRMVRSFSRSPLLSLGYTQGIPGILGSKAAFSKWRFSVTQDLNFKIGGSLKYLYATGGFLNRDYIQAPDFQHFPGNLTRKAMTYVQSFQVAPFYALSNTDRWYHTLFIEYAFNGMLTNKIPVVRRLNLRLITGANAIMTDKLQYAEYFVGLDNILKIFRLDYVWGTNSGFAVQNGLKIGIRGFSNLFTEY